MFKKIWNFIKTESTRPTDVVFGLPPRPVCVHCGKDPRPSYNGNTGPR